MLARYCTLLCCWFQRFALQVKEGGRDKQSVDERGQSSALGRHRRRRCSNADKESRRRQGPRTNTYTTRPIKCVDVQCRKLGLSLARTPTSIQCAHTASNTSSANPFPVPSNSRCRPTHDGGCFGASADCRDVAIESTVLVSSFFRLLLLLPLFSRPVRRCPNIRRRRTNNSLFTLWPRTSAHYGPDFTLSYALFAIVAEDGRLKMCWAAI